MNRRQSVAEHSYFVAAYAYDIAYMLRITEPDFNLRLMLEALYHDAHECFTGDIPGPLKGKLLTIDRDLLEDMTVMRISPRPVPSKLKPCSPDWIPLILKVANLVDEVLYLAGEIQLGNKAVRAMQNASLARLKEAWFKLPTERIGVGDLEYAWNFQVVPAVAREESICSQLITTPTPEGVNR